MLNKFFLFICLLGCHGIHGRWIHGRSAFHHYFLPLQNSYSLPCNFLMGSLEVELWDIWNGGGEAKKLCSMDFCPSFCKKLFLDSSLYVYNDIATLWFVWQFSSCARPTTIYLHYKVLFLKYSKCFKIHNGSNLYNNPYKHFLFVPNLPEFHICIEREATDVVH